MADSSGQAPAGWYPDPSGAPRQRFFDGEMWTEHYHDEPAPTPAAAGAMGATGGYVPKGRIEPTLSPIGYWKKAMVANYATFSGRARRAEYWWAYLINTAIIIALAIVGGIVLGDAGVFLPLIFALAVMIPTFASLVRRLHDTDRSGWYYLISFIPIIGGIMVLIILASAGDRGSNRYGPSPKR